MQNKKLLHIVLGFTILLQAAFFQIAMPNLVLCIGEDGHIAFEWHSQKGADHHKNRALPNLFAHSEKLKASTNSVNCTDINLHFHPSRAEKTQKQNISKMVSTVFHQFETQNQERINHPVSFKLIYSSQFNPNIGIAQSTILII